MLRNFLQKVLLKILPIETIENLLKKNRTRPYYSIVSIGERSRFYEESKVFNFRNDKSCIQIGKGSHIRGELLVFANGGEISIGSNCYVGEGTRIWSAEKVTIGDNVLISHNCNIIDTDSHELDHLERAKNFKKLVEQGHPQEKGNILTKAIQIEDYAWISYNASVLKGVRIGTCAIVGAGSVVTKDVPPYAVVVGNPARIVRYTK